MEQEQQEQATRATLLTTLYEIIKWPQKTSE